MTDFKALRDSLLFQRQENLLSGTLDDSEWDTILAALDLADKASGYREALEQAGELLAHLDEQPGDMQNSVDAVERKIRQTLQGDDNGG